MSVRFDRSRNRWVVRWHDGGRQRCRRFSHEFAAREFEAQRAGTAARARERSIAAVQRDLEAMQARLIVWSHLLTGRRRRCARTTGRTRRVLVG